MNKLKSLFAASLLLVSSFVFANSIEDAMKQMDRQTKSLFQATDSAAFQSSADLFLTAAKSAQSAKPKGLSDVEFKDYQSGLQQVIEVVDQSKKLATEGKLAEAKAALAQLDPLKKAYHKKYK